MNEITTIENQAEITESVLLGGDLSKLTPAQRVSYYRSVCDSLGVNYLTKPFDYITLNGKMTLYARKDCTDQLRKINNISITDVNIVETEKQFIVKVKGQDKDGRQDMEVGVVNKTDMRGDLANSQMKAVTKAKRRLTLSLCGLGWLDETEVQTIPDARPIAVNPDTGEIVNEKPMPYDQAAHVIVTTKEGHEKFMSELSADQLNRVYLSDKTTAEQKQAAAVILKHDFQMEPPTT